MLIFEPFQPDLVTVQRCRQLLYATRVKYLNFQNSKYRTVEHDFLAK